MLSVLCRGASLRYSIMDHTTIGELLAAVCSRSGLNPQRHCVRKDRVAMNPATILLEALMDGDFVVVEEEASQELATECAICAAEFTRERALVRGACGHTVCEACAAVLAGCRGGAASEAAGGGER